MKFSCDKCSAQYMISDDKVGPNGVRVRCKRCGNIVSVKRAPLVAPEIEPAPDVLAPSDLEPVGEQSAAGETSGETSLERELGQAFDHAFGETTSAPVPEAELEPEPAPEVEQREEPLASVIALPPPAEKAPQSADVVSAEAIEDWYVAIDDNQVGPLQATLVKARWESGEIGPDTLAWRPGMGDWMPLSSIPEMARYLAPVLREAPAAAAAAPEASVEERAAAAPSASVQAAALGATSAMNGAVSDGAEDLFRPAAGSALAALASEEISSFARPEPRMVSAATAGAGGSLAGSLVDRMGLPDGGVDPTNIVPLPIKGLETTGESEIRSKPSAAAQRAKRGKAKSSRLVVLAVAGALVLLVAGGIAIALSWTRVQPGGEQHATAPAVRSAEPPQSPQVVNDGAKVASSTPGATPAAGTPAALAPASPPSTPAAAAPAPSLPAASEPPMSRAAIRRERAAKAAAEAAARQAQRGQRRVALAPPPRAEPQAEPVAKRSSDPLLDVGDEDVEAELASKKNRRSVYVPPAIGGDLPQGVSVSQINEAVRSQTSALQRCVEQQRAADPDTRGTLKVRWTIGGDGSVRDVRVLSEEFGRQPIAPCISGVVRSLHFPRSRTTGQEVVFPFKF
jgi:predicted Zn finger-like uncharacterized protein